MSAIVDTLVQELLVSSLGTAGCGALAGLGVWVAVAASRGWLPQRTSASPAGSWLEAVLPTAGHRRIAVAGVLGAVAVGALLRLPAVGVLVVGAVWVGLDLVRGPSMTQVNEQGAAIAAWTETVRQELEAGLPQRAALIAACDLPPPGLEIALQRLGERLEAVAIPEALWVFAREVNHPAAGHAVAALDVAYRYGAANLPKLMAAQVETTRHQVQMMREIHAARAKSRRSMLLLLGLFLSVVVVLFVLWPDFLSAYRDVTGQLVLLAIGAGVLIAVRALARLSQVRPPPDFFTRPAVGPDRSSEPSADLPSGRGRR